MIMNGARGTFEVKLNPQPPEENVGDSTIGRMSIDKQFHGDLEATSKGQMLMTGAKVQGSAGYVAIERVTGTLHGAGWYCAPAIPQYVAIERVTGTLHGKSGAFALQHSGTMTRGAPQLSVTVIPDSGAGELAGLAGKMEIKIEDGKHSYELQYAISETSPTVI